jgi:hypothetical protein
MSHERCNSLNSTENERTEVSRNDLLGQIARNNLPFALGDVLADNSNDSPIDILKRTPQGYSRLDEIISTDLTEVIEIPTSGVSFFQSNLVTTSPNYNPGTGAVTGLTALRTYIFGRDGIFSINLGAQGDTGYGDGEWRNIRFS